MKRRGKATRRNPSVREAITPAPSARGNSFIKRPFLLANGELAREWPVEVEASRGQAAPHGNRGVKDEGKVQEAEGPAGAGSAAAKKKKKRKKAKQKPKSPEGICSPVCVSDDV